MEETPEGLAAAAAVREAAKRKRAAEQEANQRAKKTSRPIPTCTHEVALPDGYIEADNNLNPKLHGTLDAPRWEGELVKQYPFELDPFQRMSIACIERNESVLVAAHTSAGKTVVAEYAIAKAFKANQRVVYTSPIKALSNQKFRELSEEFEDVGIMTGDVSINPNAACIVMTTEILRSMIYRGGEILREVAWVVFDEVHYMQDRERGVVWEETIIFLPRAARCVFLSATLSNSTEFAGWVSSLHSSPCHVVYTDYRPTPLQHYAFPRGGQGLYLVKDERGRFREDNFTKMRATFGDAPADVDASNASNGGGHGGGDKQRGGGKGGGGGGKGGSGGGKGGGGTGSKADITSDIQRIVKLVKDRKMEPVIVFSFARRECEAYGASVATKVDFNSEEEKGEVEEIFNNALQCLSEEDRELDFLQKMLPMLQRGIGVHHSGLLPILKELVEILFQDHYIKVLFATETFAMGLNMPAKTCVFTALQKFDGQENRFISSGEYTQMSGRAGRRGLDDKGVVVMMVDEKMDAAACQQMIQGTPPPLVSSFKLSYYTLLNLVRRLEGGPGSMEYVISHSFQQYQWERTLPTLNTELAAIEAELSSVSAASEESISEYLSLRQQIAAEEAVLLGAITRPDRALHFLRPGRLIKVKEGGVEWGWGILVQVSRNAGPRAGRRGQEQPPADSLAPAAQYMVDVLLRCSAAANATLGSRPQPAKGDEDAEMQVLPVPLPLVTAISSLRANLPADLRPPEARRATLITIKELEKRHGGALPELDPIQDMGVEDARALQAVRAIEAAEAKLRANEFHAAEQAGDKGLLGAFQRKAQLLARADEIRRALKESQVASFRGEVKSRTAVLRKLGFVSDEGVVTLKGRAACEVDTADELLSTEMMFNGVFSSLDVHQLVALVSCLVPVEKSNEAVKLTMALADPLRQLQDSARRIAEVSIECKMEVQADLYVESFRPSLMDVVYAWSKGESFQKVCNMTDLFEGSIIRAMRRLDELMHQLERAAKAVGDEDLAKKFADSVATIRRDIVFAASLYI